MNQIKRGTVWWWVNGRQGRLHVQQGNRPVVIVSNDTGNKYADIVTVIPFTTQVKKPYPQQVPVIFNEQVSIALAEQLTCISIVELGNYIGELKDFQMQQIDRAICVQLGLCPSINNYYTTGEATINKKQLVSDFYQLGGYEAAKKWGLPVDELYTYIDKILE